MITPVVGHATCDLGLQQRLREAAVEARLRSVGRTGARSGWLARALRRRRAPGADFAFDFRPSGEDVWRALRF